MERKLSKDEKAAFIRDQEMALRAALANTRPAVDFTTKPMFGGAGYFIDGLMFAGWYSGDALHLKLSDADRDALWQIERTSAEGSHYILLPKAIVNDSAQLEHWVALSVDYVKSLPTKKRKPAKS